MVIRGEGADGSTSPKVWGKKKDSRGCGGGGGGGTKEAKVKQGNQTAQGGNWNTKECANHSGKGGGEFRAPSKNNMSQEEYHAYIRFN